MVKVWSIGVNVLCERVHSGWRLGKSPFRTVPLAAGHPLIRIRVFNLASGAAGARIGEEEEKEETGDKGGQWKRWNRCTPRKQIARIAAAAQIPPRFSPLSCFHFPAKRVTLDFPRRSSDPSATPDTRS